MGKGKAGSMHMFLPEENFMGTTAVVTTIIPVAVGAALANKYNKKNNLVFAFFGDGSLEEGGFWESVNFACLKKLPIIFICEDNGLAIHAHIKDRQSFDSITDIVTKFNCNVFKEKTTDAETIYNLTCRAIKKQKETGKPCFIHLKYYRYLEHVGVNQDFKFGYRSEDEFKKWYKVDPLIIQRKKLLKLGIAEEQIKKIEQTIDKQIDQSVDLAKKAPFPEGDEVLKDVYA